MRIAKAKSPTEDRARFGGKEVYCGREWGAYTCASVFANEHTTHGTCRVCGVKHDKASAIELFRRDLWRRIVNEEPEVLRALDALQDDSVLLCWCTTTDDAVACTTCHCGVIARCWRWFRDQH